jgi:hypothetical protein
VSRIRALNPGEAQNTIAARLGRKLAPRLFQLNTRFGVRPYLVDLVWSKWTGKERGEGDEKLIRKLPLLPTPLVDLSGITYEGSPVGRVPTGMTTMREVALTWEVDVLQGLRIPKPFEDVLPDPYDFYYEVHTDDRTGPLPQHMKFRLAKVPFLDAANVQWVLTLERMSEDAERNGQSPYA